MLGRQAGRQLEYFVLYASKFRWPSAKFYAAAQQQQHQSNGAAASSAHAAVVHVNARGRGEWLTG